MAIYFGLGLIPRFFRARRFEYHGVRGELRVAVHHLTRDFRHLPIVQTILLRKPRQKVVSEEDRKKANVRPEATSFLCALRVTLLLHPLPEIVPNNQQRRKRAHDPQRDRHNMLHIIQRERAAIETPLITFTMKTSIRLALMPRFPASQ